MTKKLVPGSNFVLGGRLPQDWTETRHSRLEASDTAFRHFDMSYIGSDARATPWTFIGDTTHCVVTMKSASDKKLMFVFSVRFAPNTTEIVRVELLRLYAGEGA